VINDNAPAAYRGLDRFVARKKVVADLEAQGLLVEVKKHKLMVPRCARTGQVIEPMLTDQWFVAMTKPGAMARASRSRRSTRCRERAGAFVPEQWVNTYDQWMNNIQDWCISAPAVVGPPDPGLVRQRTASCSSPAARTRRAQGHASRLQGR
jgi:valyl-tRNA synthetase